MVRGAGNFLDGHILSLIEYTLKSINISVHDKLVIGYDTNISSWQ